ncbi:MAG: hypothetical protein QOC92_369 [Acidimicrobiaceae bacterium]|jgi:DNA-binding NarL/FixJ family response regulator
MSVSEDVSVLSRGLGVAVVCDSNAFNLRFLRAAMTKLAYREVVETRTVEELVHRCTVMQPELIVFDPAMEDGAGLEAIEALQTAAPDALLVAFCSDQNLARSLQRQGVTVVEKISLLKVDKLLATIEAVLGHIVIDEPGAIPAADMVTPVWDLVPSLVNA